MPENEQGAQKCVTLYLLLISVLRGRHDSMVISILVVGSGETWSEMSRVGHNKRGEMTREMNEKVKQYNPNLNKRREFSLV